MNRKLRWKFDYKPHWLLIDTDGTELPAHHLPTHENFVADIEDGDEMITVLVVQTPRHSPAGHGDPAINYTQPIYLSANSLVQIQNIDAFSQPILHNPRSMGDWMDERRVASV